MSDAQKIVQQLKNDKQALVLSEGGIRFKRFTTKKKYTLQIDYLQLDKMSSELLALKVSGKELAALLATRETLEEFADSCCKKITYLPENFRIVELDSQNRQAQLRSYPPYVTATERIYFEIVLNALEGSLLLKRKVWEKATQNTRSSSFVFSDEILARIISDLIDPFSPAN